jgi:hypothetical protein
MRNILQGHKIWHSCDIWSSGHGRFLIILGGKPTQSLQKVNYSWITTIINRIKNFKVLNGIVIKLKVTSINLGLSRSRLCGKCFQKKMKKKLLDSCACSSVKLTSFGIFWKMGCQICNITKLKKSLGWYQLSKTMCFSFSR